MKAHRTGVLFVLIAALCGCGGGGAANNETDDGNAIFAPPDASPGADALADTGGSSSDATNGDAALDDGGPYAKDSDQTEDGGPGVEDALADAQPDGNTGRPDVVDPKEDVPFEDPDVGCTPNCDGRECGSDGCGSICGFCEYGTACNNEAQCIPICDPITPCEGKVCGPDGCGGECGKCPPSFACGDDGLCYEAACEPQCADRECGPDGCGGVCGKCAGTKLCDVDVGLCVSNPCGAVGFQGACASKAEVVSCQAGQLVTTDCTKQNPLWGCIWAPQSQKYLCGKPPECQPDCLELGKQCGDGGCNYSCGTCFDGWSCQAFTCVPELGAACGTVPTIGTCIDGKKYFCSKPQVGNPQILIEDCAAQGKSCKFEPALGQTVCQ